MNEQIQMKHSSFIEWTGSNDPNEALIVQWINELIVLNPNETLIVQWMNDVGIESIATVILHWMNELIKMI